jgi:hypothetical protein
MAFYARTNSTGKLESAVVAGTGGGKGDGTGGGKGGGDGVPGAKAIDYDGAPKAPANYVVHDDEDCTGNGSREKIIKDAHVAAADTFKKCWQGCEKFLGCNGFNFAYDGSLKGRCVAKGRSINDEDGVCSRKTGRSNMAWYHRVGKNSDNTTTEFVSQEMVETAEALYPDETGAAAAVMPGVAIVAAAVAAALF